MAHKVRISDLVLRDAHQSLHATRMTTADMLPICSKLDSVGYWSLEAWGGATFDACIRFLNEDPWERLRSLHKALPNTPIMMLLRGQNLLGYRHYADDVVDAFVKAAADNGVGVFRIFDALNDPRNLKRAADAAKKTGKHVQMAISFATTPYHTIDKYAELAKTYTEFGADSICIKDMAGLLKPFDAFDLVTAIKKKTSIPINIHTHATTGLSVATLLKAAEAGADILDTAISSMSMGTSHSPTETMVEIFRGTEMDTGLDINLLLEIAAYFREVRKHYAQFESSFLGADTRILVSQVPGGMLSNLENQLRDLKASDKMDAVLKEIPIVQKDCGYIPLVTPTSQIVGTQSVFNVLFGRYKKLTAETRDLLTGKYGKTPAPCNPELVKAALAEAKMDAPITVRPADLIPNELDKIKAEAKENGAGNSIEDVLTYAMFPKVAPKFFKERSKGPVVFTAPSAEKKPASGASSGVYTVTVNGTDYAVSSSNGTFTVNGTAYSVSVKENAGSASAQKAPAAAPVSAKPVTASSAAAAPAQAASASKPAAQQSAAPAQTGTGGEKLPAPVAGTLLRYSVAEGARVSEGQTVIILESMKMELEINTPKAGVIHFLAAVGAQVAEGDTLAEIR
ncbi:sodium-extruding oxaloacetate decarboxylase subunit alpha [Treponema vincentii]|uniref:Oxaloacetate decarboxylase alpha subunit n=1 Tax=Treponema vincentii ATCC 35580 TaxID=596324 RepID=C8PPD2_9SPIR|nr:sodium-extruding oxaloacetate decarboxylase subunit alpha [Treponema vincentii]EEV20704.1 oxaloacetate decarboxylase alpha subunit [Treponema vincentii ATCC 35580]UTC45282.1 sodium-extruding oxaloacetate decarboxylase subunit alpha [Treponema vincentii]UTC60221.1 sodium-extruding oxaloacetate decarboxylase subunit alpha [Treponema vincentii]